MAALLDARPVVTTATDAVDLPGLDTLGWPVEGAVAAVSRAILDGEPVRLVADAVWPLPALPPNVHLVPPAAAPSPAAPHPPVGPGPAADPAGGYRVLVTDRVVPVDDRTAVLRPPSLVAGVGASRGWPPPRSTRCCVGCSPTPGCARPVCAAWPAST